MFKQIIQNIKQIFSGPQEKSKVSKQELNINKIPPSKLKLETFQIYKNYIEREIIVDKLLTKQMHQETYKRLQRYRRVLPAILKNRCSKCNSELEYWQDYSRIAMIKYRCSSNMCGWKIDLDMLNIESLLWKLS